MKKILIFLLVFICKHQFSQHLPLQIGNQWHYNMIVPGMNYAGTVVADTLINNNTYYKIERRHYNTGELLSTNYDRFEGDSAYYRLKNGVDTLLINFNWTDGYTIARQYGNTFHIRILSKTIRNIWGFTTERYDFRLGFWVVGQPDTNWATPYSITRKFGSDWAEDGWLRGAVIGGITYGELHPLPVELISFSSSVHNKDVLLSWITTTEINNRGFEIERQKDLENKKLIAWEMIGFVQGNGTTIEEQSYTYVDENLSPGEYSYRLKQIDFDGTYEYSNIVEVSFMKPNEFRLEQNYPNPFNPSTKISWQSPVGSHQTLKVYDVLGREVATLVNEFRNAGSYEVEFDGSQLASGVYYYQLKVGEFVETRKMILIK